MFNVNAMYNEIIKELKVKEAELDKMLEEARAEADRTINDAVSKASAIKEKACEAVAREKERLKKVLAGDMEEEVREILSKAQKRAVDLGLESEKEVDKAVRLVVQSVLPERDI